MGDMGYDVCADTDSNEIFLFTSFLNFAAISRTCVSSSTFSPTWSVMRVLSVSAVPLDDSFIVLQMCLRESTFL